MSEKRMPVEVYSRVTGYFRPVKQWNPGKQEEFKERYKRNPKDIIAGMEKEPDEIS